MKKYNKYPELPSTKTALFMDRKRQPKAVLSGRMELNYVKAVRLEFSLSGYPIMHIIHSDIALIIYGRSEFWEIKITNMISSNL